MFVFAEVVANRVGYAFTDEKKRTDDMRIMPWDIYPEIFADESDKQTEAQSEAALDNYKALRKRHAEMWNKRFKENADGSGENGHQSDGGD